MLVCNVSLRAPRRAITAELIEASEAVDATTTGFIVFAALVDDPASVLDNVDAFVGEIMLEAATATDAIDGGYLAETVSVEAINATDTVSATVTGASVTWNPSDKTNTTLTNSNLTAQATTAADAGVRSTNSHSSGKYYFEVAFTGGAGSAIAGCGIVTGSASLSACGNHGLNGSIANANASTFVNGNYQGDFPGGGIGNDTICVAVDMDNKRIWYRKNSSAWTNSGNPATNTNGWDISSVFTSGVAAYAIVSFAFSTAMAGTVNFGGTAFTYTIPSGFSSWG